MDDKDQPKESPQNLGEASSDINNANANVQKSTTQLTPQQSNEDSITYKSSDLLKTKAYEKQNFFARTANQLKQDHQKAALFITFAVIILVAIVIGIILLVQALNSPEETTVETTQTTKTTKETSSQTSTCIVEDYQIPIQEIINDANQQAQLLFSNNSQNITVVTNCYASFINTALDDGYSQVAYELIFAERDFLIGKGLESEALTAMTQFDFSRFSDKITQYHIYSAVVDLAKKVGDKEIEQKYTKLADSVKGDVEASTNVYIETDTSKPGFLERRAE